MRPRRPKAGASSLLPGIVPTRREYYSCTLADPDGIAVEIVHALDDLPDRPGGERVKVPSVDGIQLGGYLFRPEPSAGGQRAGVIVLHGYGADARFHVADGRSLAAAGLVALCLSQRGWLGSRQAPALLCVRAPETHRHGTRTPGQVDHV